MLRQDWRIDQRRMRWLPGDRLSQNMIVRSTIQIVSRSRLIDLLCRVRSTGCRSKRLWWRTMRWIWSRDECRWRSGPSFGRCRTTRQQLSHRYRSARVLSVRLVHRRRRFHGSKLHRRPRSSTRSTLFRRQRQQRCKLRSGHWPLVVRSALEASHRHTRWSLHLRHVA